MPFSSPQRPSDNVPPVNIAFELAIAKAVVESIRAAIEQKRLIFKVELPAGAFQKSRAEKEYDAAAAHFRILWRDAKTPRENIQEYKEQLRQCQENNDAL